VTFATTRGVAHHDRRDGTMSQDIDTRNGPSRVLRDVRVR